MSLYWFVEASKQGHLPSVFNIALSHSERVKEMVTVEGKKQAGAKK